MSECRHSEGPLSAKGGLRVRDRSPKGRDALHLASRAAWCAAREPGRAKRGDAQGLDGETLNEALAEVSRQTGWTFELADPELGEMRVGGYVAADPEAFIGLVSSNLNLDARREGDRRIVLYRPA